MFQGFKDSDGRDFLDRTYSSQNLNASDKKVLKRSPEKHRLIDYDNLKYSDFVSGLSRVGKPAADMPYNKDMMINIKISEPQGNKEKLGSS